MIVEQGKPSISGRCIKRLDVAGIKFSDAVYPPDFRLPPHPHAQATFTFVAKGWVCDLVSSREESCGPSTLITRPPGQVHANRYGPHGARNLIIEIASHRLESIQGYADLNLRPAAVRTGASSRLADRIRRELHRADRAAALVVEGLALELLAETCCTRLPSVEGSTSKADLAAEFLRANLGQSLGLAETAKAVGVHPGHLSRIFRAKWRCSVGSYVRRLRVEWAAGQLVSSDAPIAELAAMAGFCDQSHFSNLFRQQTGLTPSEFRSARRPRR
jgi:AraC family transcriptional regulator